MSDKFTNITNRHTHRHTDRQSDFLTFLSKPKNILNLVEGYGIINMFVPN